VVTGIHGGLRSEGGWEPPTLAFRLTRGTAQPRIDRRSGAAPGVRRVEDIGSDNNRQ